MNVCTCPATQELESYLLGRMGPAEQAALDEHLDNCARCLSALDALDQRAYGMFARLGIVNVPAGADEPILAGMLRRAKALAPSTLPERQSQPGDVLGNYRLLEPIGAGGMGRVFKAEHQRMKRQVALKLLAPDMVRSPAARERFQREVEAVARVKSPHIVAAYDAGEADGHDFLVMEYVPGRNLAEVVKAEGPLSVERALRYLAQAARGLEHAHAAGIVHRDVKPANLLLDEQDIVKVSDLGLAQLERDGEPASDGWIMGTANFMAPEQATSQQADTRSDIYSLGCTLYYLLTGGPPYLRANNLDTLRAHREGPIPSLQTVRPDCPPPVERLFRKLVAKRPDDRPRSMALVRQEIEELLRRSRTRSPRRRLLAASAAATAAALGLIAVVLSRSNGSVETQAKDGPANVALKAPRLDLVRIPAGEAWIGSSDSDAAASDDEKPRRRIRITQPFLLAKTKVTQAEYEAVMGTNPSAFSAKGRFKERVKDRDTSRHPVESISWLDTVRFCNRLSERHELEPYYQIDGNNVTIRGGTGYRLPTEAEWEHACRAGTSTTWPFGENMADLGEHAWFSANSSDVTHPVAQKKANLHGLFDMLGNVSEWCWDRYDPAYYKRMPLSDPPGPGTGDTRVHRGGAWNYAASQVRPASRDSRGIGYAVLTIVGMRVARNVE